MDKRIEIACLLKAESEQLIGTTVNVKGWVRTKRGNKNVAFIALNDGSIIHNIQVVADPTKFEEELKHITTGACIGVSGKLVSIYRYGMPSTGVETVGNDAVETSHVYYNLQGVRIERPAAGQIAIRVATMSDGTVRTSKVVVR